MLTHLNVAGEAHMVDVSEKQETLREASAQAIISMSESTLAKILTGDHHKGDVFAAARIAGIQAAKKTSELIPLCHLLLLTKVEIVLTPELDKNQVRIESYCRVNGKTGVEMEALVSATAAALTIYDMCKAMQKDMIISDVKLLTKTGGKSGDYKIAL